MKLLYIPSFDFTEPGLRKKEDYKKLGNKKKT